MRPPQQGHHQQMTSNGSHHGFGETNWSLIRELQATDAERREVAMETLCRLYQGPVYTFLRHIGCDPDRAGDLTQGFFLEKVINGRLFEKADPSKARLRVLIKAALRNFRIDDERRKKARSGRDGRPTINIEREESVVIDANTTPAPEAFQQRWATAVLEEGLRRAAEHFRARGEERKWNAFYARTVRPILAGSDPVPQSEIAEEVGLDSAADVSRAVFDVRRRLHVILLGVVAETVGDPSAAEDELQELLRTLGVNRGWESRPRG